MRVDLQTVVTAAAERQAKGKLRYKGRGPTSAALLPASLGPLQGCATSKGGLAGHQAHGRHIEGRQQAGKPSAAVWADDKGLLFFSPSLPGTFRFPRGEGKSASAN